MNISYVEYPLVDGYIHNWLVGGPQALPVEGKDCEGGDSRQQIAQHYYEPQSGITGQPVEPAELSDGDFTVTASAGDADYEGRWRYVRCQEDHFLDVSTFHHTCHYLRTWAYIEVASPAAQEVTLALTTLGPADVWLNDEHVHRQARFERHVPYTESFTAHVQEGHNRILVRFEAVAVRDCTYLMALRIASAATPVAEEALRVMLPTAITPVNRRNLLERVFDAAYLKQDIFTRDERVAIHWPEEDDPDYPMEESASIMLRLRTPQGKTYAETYRMGRAGNHVEMGYTYQFPASAYDFIIMPRPREYYEGNMRVRRELPFWGLDNNRYMTAPYDTFDERRKTALIDAARREKGVFSEIAKMAIGWWSRLKVSALLEAIAGINARRDCSDFYLVGLLGMYYRFGDHPDFPQELVQPLESCILNFKYWHDEPGTDAMCYDSENHQILFHTCEILAGQLYPDRVFSNAGETGQWHREKGERLALAWLRERGMRGFSEWDSNCYFEEDLLAISHLADLAESDSVWELAMVLMDKLFFSIALNSYQGVFGSTHGRTYAPQLKGGYLEATSGITNLMWGQGVFNEHIRGTVSLACMEDYQLPVLLQYIATTCLDEVWSRERHAPRDAFRGTQVEVNKVTYKTPDYMLCSAQDYHAGERGYQQHIWQATLGPGATVFANHPASASEAGSQRPNFWCGNFILPRVAQWKDVLVALYDLPEDDWMGFTHAYFPTHAFDEHAFREGWAFARKGEGYLALTCSQPMTFLTHGRTAYRELRAPGQQAVWLCHMGRAALDGDFAHFQEQILGLEVAVAGLDVQLTTLRGDELAFGWDAPFLRNGEEVPLRDFMHYDSPYCVAEFPAEQMDIRYGDTAMRLKFAE